MASDVDICNLALATLGDDAAVTSISPADGSSQSSHCSRFYPIARDALLEMHTWGFSTTRAALTPLVANPSTDPYNTALSTWLFAYAAPSDVVNYLEVLDPGATDDLSVGVSMQSTIGGQFNTALGVYVPQPFTVETDANGNDIVYTNQENAMLRYTRLVSDTSKFSPLFTEALVMLLSAHLAGPIIKGSEGRNASADIMSKFFTWWKEKAVESDANQRRIHLTQGAPWMVGR